MTESAVIDAPAVHRTTTDNPEDAAHIVRHDDSGKSPQELVMEARLYGYPVQALCGHTFVPQKDATRLPMCSACKEIVDERTNGRSHEIEQ